MLLSSFEGLKYPDEYMIKFFFKEMLLDNPSNVLELGCGNGNNLMLFYNYGWNVTGVDIDKKSIDNAINNFDKIKYENKNLKNFNLFYDDMGLFLENNSLSKFDVILIPSSIYYLDYNNIIKVFKLIKEKKILSKNALFFIRFRNIDDYRFGKGKKIGDNSFVLDIDETGEKGCINTFFSKDNMIEILEEHFCFEYKYVLRCFHENLQNNHITSNSDYIIWGKIAS